MPRPLPRVAAALLLGLISGFACYAQVQPARAQSALDETRLVVLHGTRHPLARPENDAGAVPDVFFANRMIVQLNPPADRKQAMETFLHDAHTPGSGSYHKWISPEEFGTTFGALDTDIQQVRDWLQSHGFLVARLTKSRRFLEFSGTAAQVREALHSEIHEYQVAGKTYFSVSSEVSVPDALAPIIRGFAPLNTFPLASFVHTMGKGTLSPSSRRIAPDFTTAAGGKTFYALAPQDFATQYDIGPVYLAGTDGTGQTVGVVNEFNLNLSLVDAFRKLYGLPGDNTQVVIDGEDPGVGLSQSVEGFLDVEVSGAIATKAKVDYYIAGGSNFQSPLVLAALRAVEDNEADVLSVSYGMCEQLLGVDGNLFWSSLWEQAAAQGQTVMVSAGDSGPETCPFAEPSSNGQLTYLPLGVNGLASTPWNMAVGGTDFYYSDYATGGASIAALWNSTNTSQFGSLIAPLPEQPWDDPLGLNIIPPSAGTIPIPGSAGGGGPSSCAQFANAPVPPGTLGVCAGGYPKPAWQSAPGVPSDGVRDLPDVSLFAANGGNLTAWAICADPGDCAPATSGEPQVLLVGGTSASAPALAGIMALVDQKFGRQGQANFTLYALGRQNPGIFHDVTIGTNDVLCMVSSQGCNTPVPNTDYPFSVESFGIYPAGPGYDLASGLGSLDVNALLRNWNEIAFLPTTTTLQLSSSSIVHGTGVGITAIVKANSGSQTPSGDVNIRTTSPLPLIGTREITLAGGAAVTNWNFFPGGTYQVVAQYAGDGTFGASASTLSTLNVTPEPSTTALSLRYEYDETSTTPPTVQTGSLTNGGQAPFSSLWTFQAQPSGQTSQTTGDATGAVTFTDGPASVTVPLNSQGIATWAPHVLAIGAHSVTANYSGDASYNSSIANPLTFTISKGIPRLTASLEGLPVSLGPGSAVNYQAGSTAMVHVLLGALNSFVAPTGNVTVNFGSLQQTSALAPEAYSNQGLSAVNFIFTDVPAGTYALSVSYAGDNNWNSSLFTSPTSYMFATETASPTTTTLSLSPSSVDSSGSVKFIATVTASQGQFQLFDGLVLLSANGTIFSSLTLTPTNTSVATGSVNVPATALPSGPLQVLAAYMGNIGFAPSIGAPVPLNVTFSDFTMSAGNSRVEVKSGQSVSIPLQLGGPNAGSATVSLACAPSSPSIGCSVSSPTIVAIGTTSASVVVNAFVSGTNSSAMLKRPGRKPELLGASVLFSFGLLFVVFQPRQNRRGMLFRLALLAGVTFIAGCGSASSPGIAAPPPNLNAPAGTYNIVVTGSSGNITHNATITVVIR